MNGATWEGAYAALPTVEPAWDLAASGDFNADGQPDLLWQHLPTGQRVIWFLNGAVWEGAYAYLPQVDPAWSIAGVGDFNADNQPDILWQHASGQRAIWFMRGASYEGQYALLPQVDPAWQIAAAGDFNGDGRPDLLWQHTSGARAIWFLNGAAYEGQHALLPTVDPAWQIAGAADFNGDGKPDILWQHTSGIRVIWFMNGAAYEGQYAFLPQVDPSWRIAATLGGVASPVNPLPTISSISPDTMTAGRPGFTLTVNGSGFVPASVVRWNGSARPTTFVNGGQLQAAIPASDVATAGTAQVTVYNPSPGGGTSQPKIFQGKAPAPGSLALGDTVAGEINPPGEVDRYTFSATKGTEVNLFARGLSNTNFEFIVRSPSGGNVEGLFVGWSQKGRVHNTGRFTLPVTGTYTVEVQGSSSTYDQGAYEFWLFPINRAPESIGASIAIGDTIRGESISPVGDVDEFTFSATAGTEVNFHAQGLSGSYFEWRVLSPSGAELKSQIFGGQELVVELSGRFTLPVTGTYTVEVQSIDQGAYEFWLFPINRAPESIGASIAIGDTIRGESISPAGDVDEFTFSATAGTEVEFFARDRELSGTSFVLRVLSPSGAELKSQIFGDIFPESSTGRFTLPVTGTYTVEVQAYSSSSISDQGAYEFWSIRY